MLERIIRPVAGEMAMMDALIERGPRCELACAAPICAHVAGIAGKRIRPAIFLLASKAISNGSYPDRREELVRIATSIEMIHTASLLHDDVIDGATARRGGPSANARFGNRASVLMGDLLWCEASDLVIAVDDRRLIEELTRAARATTMGEMMETMPDMDKGSCISMMEGKTGSLFSAAGRLAAIAGKAGSDEEASLAEYGRCLGISFQLTDDLVDSSYGGGDPVSSRNVELVGGGPAARRLAREHGDRACEALARMRDCPELRSLVELANYVATRGS
jgi:octaprenyl-diphosphate synthase